MLKICMKHTRTRSFTTMERISIHSLKINYIKMYKKEEKGKIKFEWNMWQVRLTLWVR